jgi:hypothetical protein
VKPFGLVLLTLTLSAQTTSPLQTDLANAAAAIAAAQTAAVPSAPDPVVTEMQAAGLYQAALTCSATPGCVLTFIGYTCPGPAQWTANTAYEMGQKAEDAAGNTWTVTQLISGTTQALSGTVEIAIPSVAAVGSIIQDNQLVWTLTSLSTTAQLCVQQGSQPLTVAK